MDCDPRGCPTVENYEGHQIVLTPGQHEEGTWVCEYVIIEPESTASPSTRGYSEGAFHSPNEARVAALVTAKTIINSRMGTNEAETSPAS